MTATDSLLVEEDFERLLREVRADAAHKIRPGVELHGRKQRREVVYYPWMCAWCGEWWECLPGPASRRGCPAALWG